MQGSFDFVGASLRDAATPLKMTMLDVRSGWQCWMEDGPRNE